MSHEPSVQTKFSHAWAAAIALFGAACGAGREAVPSAPAVETAAAVSAPAASSATPGTGAAGATAHATASAATGSATASAPAAPSPISGDLPADAEGPLARSESCAAKTCVLAGVLPGQAVADPASPALVWSHDLGAPGATVRFPRHASVDVYGVVLKGAVTLRGDEGGPALGAKRWVAFRAPGAGASVAASEAGARVLLAVVTAGEPLRDALATPAAGAAWKTRPAALAVVDLAASKDLAWGGGAMHARLGFQGAGQRASLGLLMASADAQVARHRHDDAWEILVALRASGTAGRAAGGGALEGSRLEDGGVVAMPRGIDHAWTPDGKKALVAVQLYVPPGPEQRFKKLAGVE